MPAEKPRSTDKTPDLIKSQIVSEIKRVKGRIKYHIEFLARKKITESNKNYHENQLCQEQENLAMYENTLTQLQAKTDQ